MQGSVFNFCGDNAVIYLSGSKAPLKLYIEARHNCVFHLGKDTYINQRVSVILSEQRHMFIGDDCFFSLGIWCRNADPHIIYDAKTMRRINPTRSIYLGDHVWVGQGAMILKGTQIGSGSIVGGMSVVAGKHIGNNESWAGNPAKKIAQNIFWDGFNVNMWKEEETENSQDYNTFVAKCRPNISPDAWIYKYDKDEAVYFNDIDARFNKAKTSQELLDILKALNENKKKNRFVYNQKKWF